MWIPPHICSYAISILTQTPEHTVCNSNFNWYKNDSYFPQALSFGMAFSDLANEFLTSEENMVCAEGGVFNLCYIRKLKLSA